MINFDFVHTDITVPDAKQPRFVIRAEGCKRIFDLKTDDVETRDEWVNLLSKHITLSTGRRRSLMVSHAKFWKHDSISEENFLNAADTGDVLLF